MPWSPLTWSHSIYISYVAFFVMQYVASAKVVKGDLRFSCWISLKILMVVGLGRRLSTVWMEPAITDYLHLSPPFLKQTNGLGTVSPSICPKP